MTTNDLVLGVDIGTSSTKGVLVQPDGTIVATAQRPHQLSLPRHGWAEHDGEVIWWADFMAIARELATHAHGGDDGGRIAAVCVSGIGPAVLPVDAAGRALRPAILYGIDTRAMAEVVELTERFGADVILARGGSLLTSQAAGPKLAWIRRHEPDVWAVTRRFHMAHSLVIERITGEYVLDHHSASQCDPLYDMTTAAWATDWAADVLPGLDFPRLAWSNEVAGRVHAEGAALTGIPEGTPVVTGTIDAWAEALSAGVRDPGDTMLMYGTTMFIVEIARAYRPDARLWTTQGVFAGTTTYAAGLSTSGGLTTWLSDIVGRDLTALIAEAAQTRPGADGLVVLPYFGVARSPIFDPEARGAIFGLTLSHGRGHLFRAMLEGSAYEVRHNLGVMEAAGVAPAQLTAVGGGTKSGLWTQIVSNVTGLRQLIPAVTIGASFGDAMLAAAAVGLISADARWNAPAETVVPDARTSIRYDELYAIYRSLYPATSQAAHSIARMAVDSAGSAHGD